MNNDCLHIAAYLPRSRANGPELRSVLWVQGCPFRCAGCFNPDFLPFAGSREVATRDVADWMLTESETEGVSFSGGEPFAQAGALAEVAERVRAAGKGVLVFTGYDAIELRSSRNPGFRRLLLAADLLVAGRYRSDMPGRHPLLASANQELVLLTERYRGADFGGRRRTEFRIAASGTITVSGFPDAPWRLGANEVTG
jgi:anaerobic ribonucleoside-triphosphate reductase activating protein